MRSSKLTIGLAILATLLAVDSALAYYNPATGRFIGRDPVGEPGAMLIRQVSRVSAFLPRDLPGSEEAHTYAYAMNEPISRFDALGLRVAANPRCHLFQDCRDCWQTCQQNRHLFGPGVAGLTICRDDGCMCACSNNALFIWTYGPRRFGREMGGYFIGSRFAG